MNQANCVAVVGFKLTKLAGKSASVALGLLGSVVLAGTMMTASDAHAITCATGTGVDVTLDLTTRCLDNTSTAGTVTVTAGANALATWSTYSGSGSLIGNDSVGGNATISSILIPLGTSLTTASNGNYFITNGEYQSTSTSAYISTINSITNNGSIAMQLFLYNDHHGVIGSVTNNGSISSQTYNMDGRIDNFVNNGTLSGAILNFTGLIGTFTNAVGATMGAFTSGGTVTSFTNAGTMTGALTNTGTVGILSNSGTFTGAITNSGVGVIGELNNSGALKSVSNSGTGEITTFTNTGTIGSGGASAVVTNNGKVTTFNNSQSGLVWANKLPLNYNMAIASPTSYGSTTFLNPTGVMTFGLTSTSTVARGTYQDVLTGITAANLANTSGTFGIEQWSLVFDGTNYDLVIGSLGPSAPNTAAAILRNATAIRTLMDNRISGLAHVTGYDCATFDKHGVCISFQARYSSFDAMHEGAGVFTAAVRLNPNWRIGGFIDYRASEREPNGLRLSGELPTLGGFIAYSQSDKGLGLQARASAALQRTSVAITRSTELENTEAGSGKARLNSYVFSGELGWGIDAGSGRVLTPFVGLRHIESNRSAYMERLEIGSVEFPLSYNAYAQRLTTLSAGVRLSGMLSDRLGYRISGAVEHDVSQRTSAYSGTSAIPDLETFRLAMEGVRNRTRATATAGAFYNFLPNHRVTTSVSVSHQAYTNRIATTVMAGYQGAF